MSWEDLFADLEAQFEALQRRDRDAEIADRTRRERAAVDLISRLAGHRGRPLAAHLVTGGSVRGDLLDLGGDWLALADGARTVLVALPAVVAFDGLGGRVEPAKAARRFGLGYVLRGLGRDRSVVALTDRSRRVVTGTIASAGADHVDVAVHPADEPGRAAVRRGLWTIPYAALVTVAPAG